MKIQYFTNEKKKGFPKEYCLLRVNGRGQIYRKRVVEFLCSFLEEKAKENNEAFPKIEFERIEQVSLGQKLKNLFGFD